jgi:alpha-tubulin suppressor-like RCC1 family protein
MDVIAIGAGLNHFVALKSNGTLVVWGDNSLNQCNIPSNMSRIKSFSTGYNHTLAIDINGKFYAWGDNRMGQCNIPNVQ